MFRKVEEVEATPSATPYVLETHEKALMQEEVPLHVEGEELAEATACLEAAHIRNKSRNRTMRGSLLAVSGVILAASLSMFYALGHGVTPAPWTSLLLALGSNVGVGAVAVGGFFWARKSRRPEHAAAGRLVEIEDVRGVASLIDTVVWLPDKALHSTLWQALGRLLPQLTEEEALELGKERHALLATWIQAWDYPLTRHAYVKRGTAPLIGMLHVMAHVGQNRFHAGDQPIKVNVTLLPSLEKWAAGQGIGQDPAVQQAATACREAILQKMALAKSGAQLLRASAPTPAGSETLLRPAQGAEQTDPQELLRPNTAAADGPSSPPAP